LAAGQGTEGILEHSDGLGAGRSGLLGQSWKHQEKGKERWDVRSYRAHGDLQVVRVQEAHPAGRERTTSCAARTARKITRCIRLEKIYRVIELSRCLLRSADGIQDI
jgi:hypothetical protein